MVSVPSMTRLVWLALAAGWMGFLYYLSSQSVIGIDAIDSGSDSSLALRKLALFLAFGLLALLSRWGLGQVGWRPSISVAAFAIPLVYAVGDEYHQSLVSGRYGAASDVSIDAAGAATAFLAWRFVEPLSSGLRFLGRTWSGR